MIYRVRDTKQNKWIKDDVYLSPDDRVHIAKFGFFGNIKELIEDEEDRYITHKYIGLLDKNDMLIYEGDYIKAQVADDRSVIGLVVFATELSSYIILCVDGDEFYTLGNSVSTEIQIVGNVFDGIEENDEEPIK